MKARQRQKAKRKATREEKRSSEEEPAAQVEAAPAAHDSQEAKAEDAKADHATSTGHIQETARAMLASTLELVNVELSRREDSAVTVGEEHLLGKMQGQIIVTLVNGLQQLRMPGQKWPRVGGISVKWDIEQSVPSTLMAKEVSKVQAESHVDSPVTTNSTTVKDEGAVTQAGSHVDPLAVNEVSPVEAHSPSNDYDDVWTAAYEQAEQDQIRELLANDCDVASLNESEQSKFNEIVKQNALIIFRSKKKKLKAKATKAAKAAKAAM